MADNRDLAALTGNCAADEVTYSGDTALVQLMKLVFIAGSEGSKTVVDWAGDSAGNANVLARRGLVRISTQSGGLTTATTAYTAGDQVGTQFTMAGAARASGGTGTIVGCLLISAADIIGNFDVLVSRASITPAADNAAFAISDADALNTVALIPLAGAYDIGNNRLCQAFNLAIPYDCSGGTSLYCNLITRVGHTFFGAATDLQLIMLVELN